MVLEVVLMYMTFVRQSSVALRTAASFDPSRHLCRQDVQTTDTYTTEITQHELQTHTSGLRVNHKWAKSEQQASSHDPVNPPHIQDSLQCPVRAYRRMLLHVTTAQRKTTSLCCLQRWYTSSTVVSGIQMESSCFSS